MNYTISALLLSIASLAVMTSSVPVAAAEPAPAEAEVMYIPVMAKGFQHQFWQAVKTGAEAAAKDLGVEIYFDGPASETEIDAQVNMVKNELAKNPKALALAALSTEAVTEILEECAEKGIPVIGFDSGVPNDKTGAVKATASTNNENAAAIAATKFGENAELVAKIEATGSDPREYVEIKYSVSEAKFKAWPQSLRAPFEALRTVTPKAAKFVLRRIGEKK